jgi:hypothetical protein
MQDDAERALGELHTTTRAIKRANRDIGAELADSHRILNDIVCCCSSHRLMAQDTGMDDARGRLRALLDGLKRLEAKGGWRLGFFLLVANAVLLVYILFWHR